MPQKSEKPFQLVAGHLALDFVNTLDDVYAPDGPKELLGAYEDLLRFAEQTGISSVEDCERLRSHVSLTASAAAVREAHILRSCLTRIFGALAEGAALGPEELHCLNSFLPDALRHRRIDGMGDLHWAWDNDVAEATGPLWPIIVGAAELLISDERQYVKACSSETCRWLFLDTSKNRTRRWCDMKLCGNRAKAREHYRRSVEASARSR